MATTGVLLLNVGTPGELTVSAVRRYLAEFLSDPYVVDYPRWLWLPFLHGLILRVRPRRSLERYQKIWTGSGSPMQVYMGRIASKLQERYHQRESCAVHFEVAMRYGSPSIPEALERLKQKSPDRILSFPLFPQYSITTTGTIQRALSTAIPATMSGIEHQCIPDYHDHPAYLNALQRHICDFWSREGKPQRILFSFHGIPARIDVRGDPYAGQCQSTAKRLSRALGLEQGDWRLGYQSRFGVEPWLKPYVDELLVELGRGGVESLHVVAPGFAVDCLETLEEIEQEGGSLFKDAGGGRFRYLPALNAEHGHIEALSTILDQYL